VVTAVDDDGVTLTAAPPSAAERISVSNQCSGLPAVAGIAARKEVGASLDRAGRVATEPTLAIPGYPTTYGRR